MNTKKTLLKRGWIMLIIPPFTLLLITMFFGLGWGIMGSGDPSIIQNGIRSSMPLILFANHIFLFLLLMNFMKRDGLNIKDIGWSLEGIKLPLEIAMGVTLGFLLYVYHEWAIEPMSQLIGGRSVNFSIPFEFKESIDWPFFAAATILPFIEESIYRGYAWKAFKSKYGVVSILIISSLFFGPLHWGLGVSGIVITMTFGVILFMVFIWRKNLIAVTIGHIIYNGIIVSFI